MGRDVSACSRRTSREISIHSPRMGRDSAFLMVLSQSSSFQSTLPAWGETSRCCSSTSGTIFQSTLPAWGETWRWQDKYIGEEISIHSPRMGRDTGLFSTVMLDGISIHSPRMGRDSVSPSLHLHFRNFNPLSPHGERHRYQGLPS